MIETVVNRRGTDQRRPERSFALEALVGQIPILLPRLHHAGSRRGYGKLFLMLNSFWLLNRTRLIFLVFHLDRGHMQLILCRSNAHSNGLMLIILVGLGWHIQAYDTTVFIVFLTIIVAQ